MASRSYTVVGAGAVGLLYGTRLAAAGHHVQWVVRSGADTIRREGINVRSQGLDLSIAPADVVVVDDPARADPADLVIVALKTTANQHLADLVGPAVADGATVAMFQNGLGVEEAARDAIPMAGAVLGAMCFVCAHRLGPGRADHLDYGAVTVGELGSGGPSSAAASLVDDLNGVGVEATAVDDLAVARWRKLAWNIPFNGLSVLLDASTDELLSDPSVRSLVVEVIDEVVEAAAACGAGSAPGLRDELIAMTEAMTPYAPSMKLDHDASRPLEMAAIYDAPLEAADAAGAPMTRVGVLARQLHLVDRRVRGLQESASHTAPTTVSDP